ncbi:MAG: hypothetical protein R2825_19790 [Saprospiraceae bacterium]
MKNNQQDNFLVDLFTEEAVQSFGSQKGGSTTGELWNELTFSEVSTLPILHEAELASEEELRNYWRTLRTFFLQWKRRTFAHVFGKVQLLPCPADALPKQTTCRPKFPTLDGGI